MRGSRKFCQWGPDIKFFSQRAVRTSIEKQFFSRGVCTSISEKPYSHFRFPGVGVWTPFPLWICSCTRKSMLRCKPLRTTYIHLFKCNLKNLIKTKVKMLGMTKCTPSSNMKPLCANELVILVLYNTLRMVHCID